MNDLTILYLSDLHINTNGTHLSNRMSKLLDDIKKQMQYSE